MQVIKGSTNVSVDLYIVDSDGTPETGVLYNTSGIDLKYRRDGAAVTSITEADLTTPALTDAHEDGGFLEIGNGWYRLDVPDAAFASGVDKVLIFGTVTGMVVYGVSVDLVEDIPGTLAALNDISVADILAGVCDTGVTVAKAGEMLAALAAGEVTASSVGGVTTLAYKKRDGTTTSFTAVVTESDKTRATTGALS